MERDSVEREVFIKAPVERVWSFVSMPGWFIDDGSERAVTGDATNAVVELASKGKFHVKTVKKVADSYVAMRCVWTASSDDEEPDEHNSTLIEFTLAAEPGGTRLRVVESGFKNLGLSAEARRKQIEGNARGWTEALETARKRAESD